MIRIILFLGFYLLTMSSYAQKKSVKMIQKVEKTEKEWKQILTPNQFNILRLKGTDYPSEKGYTMHFKKGVYQCAGCGLQLFESSHKFKSHCGWPSFDKAIKGTITYIPDNSHGMVRTEIVCASCGGHLGHVFDDGPKQTTGKRYCVNSTSIQFKTEEKK